jgi:delta 1-pyrroline-5-carboxylate dehydrogenase
MVIEDMSRIRAYAPVGALEDPLPFLVRRLIKTSYVRFWPRVCDNSVFAFSDLIRLHQMPSKLTSYSFEAKRTL